MVTPPPFRTGYVALLGEPNVGKSTLMNRLLGQKISIVTPKPQTTRHTILGILSTDLWQMIFLDTPGIIEPKYLLQNVMMKQAAAAIDDADLLLLLIDATGPDPATRMAESGAFRLLQGMRKPVYLAINKVDLVEKPALLPIIDSASKSFPFREIVPISALSGDNTDPLVNSLAAALPEHPPFYPLDIVSEQTERFFVGEIVREKIFLLLKEEVPYSTTVDVVEFREQTAEKTFIGADIVVERESQKGILIGRGGTTLKRIGSIARKDIERFLNRPVYLELHVKVRKDWRQDGAWLNRLGYEREP